MGKVRLRKVTGPEVSSQGYHGSLNSGFLAPDLGVLPQQSETPSIDTGLIVYRKKRD